MTTHTLTFATKIKQTNTSSTLSKEKADSFYAGFREEIAPVAKQIRDQEKKAYEEARRITLA